MQRQPASPTSRNATSPPPGPADRLPLGINRDTLQLFQRLQRRYGDLVGIRQPNGRPAILVNDPEEVRGLLVRRHGRYRKGPGFERVKMLLGNGLIVSDGDTWRRARRMIQPSFGRSTLNRMLPLVFRCVERLEERWVEAATRGEAVNVTRATSEFALELILHAIFGKDCERYILSGQENPFAFLSEDASRDLRAVMKMRELRTLLLTVIESRRRDGNASTDDFLGGYLAARDRQGQPFSDTELLDEIVNLIVAGYETSAGTLNWAWYLLAGHPEAAEKVAAEASGLTAPDAGMVGTMVYTQAVLEETLRLYPPVWLFTRRALAGDTIAGFNLEEGSDVYLSPYLLHHTPEHWPEPERFDPGRFAAIDARKSELPYFPFSLGPRRCLGEYFSFLEMKVHVGLLSRRLRMHRLAPCPPELELGINLRAQADIVLQPELRTTAI